MKRTFRPKTGKEFFPAVVRALRRAAEVDRKPAQKQPWTEKLWIYDLRINKHFTLKESELKRSDLDDFVAC